MEGDKERVPYSYTYFTPNFVSDFFNEVLKDRSPFPWQNSASAVGHEWGTDYDSMDDFRRANPEFGDRHSRPLTKSDFDAGLVKSDLMRRCVADGVAPEVLGTYEVEENGCGGNASTHFNLRRPYFVTVQIENTSDHDIVINGMLCGSRRSRGFHSSLYKGKLELDQTEKPQPPLKLTPGESLVVPVMCLLGPLAFDDYHLDVEEMAYLSDELAQSFGLAVGQPRELVDDYLLIGPVLQVSAFQVESNGGQHQIPLHDFDPSHCHLWYRSWLVGSCPHLYGLTAVGWSYLGEVLSNGYLAVDETRINVSEPISKLRIVETDFETSCLTYIEFQGVPLITEHAHLERGEWIELSVRGVGEVVVKGWYDAAIPRPQIDEHLRQQRSLRLSYEARVSGML